MAANVTGTLRLTQARAARDVARRGGRERHLGGRRPPDLGRLRHLEARPGRDHLRCSATSWRTARSAASAINPGGTRTAMRAAAYPDEDPATVPHPSSRVAPFIAVLAGEDPGPFVEAAQWTGG